MGNVPLGKVEGDENTMQGRKWNLMRFLKVFITGGSWDKVEKQIEALNIGWISTCITLSSTGINNTNANFNLHHSAYYQCIMDYLLLKLSLKHHQKFFNNNFKWTW